MKQSELIDHMAMELFWCSMQKKNEHRGVDLIVHVHKMGSRSMFHFAIGMYCCMMEFRKYLQKELPEIADEIIDDICMRLKHA